MLPHVAAGTTLNGKTTGAFNPGGAGRWMCDAAAGPPIRPVHDSFTVIWSVASLKRTVPKPVAVDWLGGTSCEPVRFATNRIEAFSGAAAHKMATRPKRLRLRSIFFSPP